MPAAVTAAANTTPTVARSATTGKSFWSSFHLMHNAASNTKGGKKIEKIKSLDNCSCIRTCKKYSPMPASTRPTVYGICRRRVSIATNAETNRSKPSCERFNVMEMLLDLGTRSQSQWRSTLNPAQLVFLATVHIEMQTAKAES
jgi:hypothetical protein